MTTMMKRGAVRARAFAWLRCGVMVLAVSGLSACGLFQGLLPERGGMSDDPGGGTSTGTGSTPDAGTRTPLATDACPGAAECLIDEPKEDPQNDPCPTGTCDPGQLNGKGIYIAESFSYCFDFGNGVCPQSFVNTPNGVRFRFMHYGGWPEEVELALNLVAPPAGSQHPKLLRIHSEQGQLVIQYRLPPGKRVYTVRGDDLDKVRLAFSFSAFIPAEGDKSFAQEMRIIPIHKEDLTKDGMPRYSVAFRDAGGTNPSVWTHHCAKDKSALAASFLDGRRVDARSGEVTLDATTTTLSCETGAIDTCLSWGYKPWLSLPEHPEAGEYLFRSCVQAKRAAYFAGFGDFSSYTENGTPIIKRDQYGISTDRIPYVEAIWGPHGAVCLNPENLRIRQGANFDTHGLPRCTDWTPDGKLATGPEHLPTLSLAY